MGNKSSKLDYPIGVQQRKETLEASKLDKSVYLVDDQDSVGKDPLDNTRAELGRESNVVKKDLSQHEQELSKKESQAQIENLMCKTTSGDTLSKSRQSETNGEESTNFPQPKQDKPKDTKQTTDSQRPPAPQPKPQVQQAASPTRTRENTRVQLAANREPLFFIGGYNGEAMIEKYCAQFGWRRTKDRYNSGYHMKWCEFTSHINYENFKEGRQMVNHIPNNHLLTNKLGLLKSLKNYARICKNINVRTIPLDFIPETFCLDNAHDRRAFREVYKEGTQWICKPTGTNQGRGIYIVKSKEDVDELLQEKSNNKPYKPMDRILQRYLAKPLLLNKKKFDIRCYMLIASTKPYLVLFHKGYTRLCILDYDTNTENKIAHLTNQFIQKKDPSYKDVKEETTWSMERFNDYVNEHYMEQKGIKKNWVLEYLPWRMKQIMVYCFNCVKSQLQCKIGYHDLYGFDFLIDEDMKVWLIEVNVNPCLAINCSALRDVIPGVVRETIHVANECFEKARNQRPLLPLKSMRNFKIIYRDSQEQIRSPRKAETPRATPTRNQSPHRYNKSPARASYQNNSPPLSRRSERGQTLKTPRGSLPIRSKTFVPPATQTKDGSKSDSQLPKINTNIGTRKVYVQSGPQTLRYSGSATNGWQAETRNSNFDRFAASDLAQNTKSVHQQTTESSHQNILKSNDKTVVLS